MNKELYDYNALTLEQCYLINASAGYDIICDGDSKKLIIKESEVKQ